MGLSVSASICLHYPVHAFNIEFKHLLVATPASVLIKLNGPFHFFKGFSISSVLERLMYSVSRYSRNIRTCLFAVDFIPKETVAYRDFPDDILLSLLMSDYDCRFGEYFVS